MAEHGTFMWNELMTRDVDASKAFYGDILGWSFQEMDVGTGPYTIASVGDTPVGGMMRMDGPQFESVPPHWAAYIKVDDVDAVVAKVPDAGGTVLMPAFDVPTVGRIAIIQDPTGAAIGVMTPAEA